MSAVFVGRPAARRAAHGSESAPGGPWQEAILDPSPYGQRDDSQLVGDLLDGEELIGIRYAARARHVRPPR